MDLTRMLEQVASEFRPIFAESGLSCSLDLPPKLHYSCDPDKLARVFDNLLRNASYYSLPDSTVEIAGRIEAGKSYSPSPMRERTSPRRNWTGSLNSSSVWTAPAPPGQVVRALA